MIARAHLVPIATAIFNEERPVADVFADGGAHVPAVKRDLHRQRVLSRGNPVDDVALFKSGLFDPKKRT